MKLSWNWLSDYVKVSRSAEEVAEKLTLAGLEVKQVLKIGSDYMLETEVTSNRPDWLSHIGVAREISVLYRRPLLIPKNKIASAKKPSKITSVAVQSKMSCPYYSCMELTAVQTVATPQWMRVRLEVCGVRSVNFVVDTTNYVLLETGQPLHAFDLDRLEGSKIIVRPALKNEKFVAIDNNVYLLTESDFVISDESKAVAIGGVMGGRETEVSETTGNILLESASFNPACIRKTSRNLKLSSDSSYRFERGVDPLGIDFARNRAASIISEHAEVAEIHTPVFKGTVKSEKRKIQVSIPDIAVSLGPVSIKASEAKSMLNSLGIKTKVSNKKIVCEPPTFRPDITMKEDLIEEIARIYGYNRIPETIPSAPLQLPNSNAMIQLSNQLSDTLSEVGLWEVVTYSILNPHDYEKFEPKNQKWVSIDNPRNQNLTLMRPSLSQSMVEVAGRNINMGNASVSIFEIANVYKDSTEILPREIKSLGLLLAGSKKASYLDQKRQYQFSDLKGLIELVCKKAGKPQPSFLKTSEGPECFQKNFCYEIRVDGSMIAFAGLMKLSIADQYRIESEIYYSEISINQLAEIPDVKFSYREISKYPAVERDLSLILDEAIIAENIVNQIRSMSKGLIRGIRVFDLYRSAKLPKGKKSVAFRIEYQSYERTLSAVEVNDLHFSIINELNKQFKAELPSKPV